MSRTDGCHMHGPDAATMKKTAMNNGSQQLTYLSLLSRNQKVEEFLTKPKVSPVDVKEDGPERKKQRKLPDLDNPPKSRRSINDHPLCFKVCEGPQFHGKAMICRRPISCGQVIIPPESPIVSVQQETRHKKTGNNLFCEHCSAPMGTLRQHIDVDAGMSAMAEQLYLPVLGVKDSGPQFSTPSSGTECRICSKSIWCSTKCQHIGALYHVFFHCSTSETNEWNVFLQSCEAGHRTLMELASQGMLYSLACMSQEIEQNDGLGKEASLGLWCWWNEYGSHPLWWEVGDPQAAKLRQDQTASFCKVWVEWIIERWKTLSDSKRYDWLPSHLKWIDGPTYPLAKAYLEKEQRENLLQMAGTLLGMLHTNVMAWEFSTPLQQYVEHLGHLEDDGTPFFPDPAAAMPLDHKNLESSDAIVNGQVWLQNHAEKLQELGIARTGSALYPLLTLANHSCRSNASIDFLQESHQGCMVALRDIAVGEEICITYVPNGEDDTDLPASRFDAFAPTRTWLYLNASGGSSSCCSSSELDVDEAKHDDDEDDDEEEEDSSHREEQEEEVLTSNAATIEGMEEQGRRTALREYGFTCHCVKCKSQRD